MFVAQRQARFQVGVGVAGGGGVGADRQPERFVGNPIGTEQPGHGPLRAGRHNGHRRVDPASVGLHADDPVAVEHRHRLGIPHDLGTGLTGGVDQCGIESTARPHRAVVREAVGRRPVEFTDLRAGDHPQSTDRVRVAQIDPEFLQRADGSRREAVAADLVATVAALLEHHH